MDQAQPCLLVGFLCIYLYFMYTGVCLHLCVCTTCAVSVGAGDSCQRLCEQELNPSPQ